MSQQSRKEQLLEMLQTEPDQPFLLFALAKEYENEKKLDLAAITYSQLFQSHENYLGTYYHYGKLMEQLKKSSEAKEIYLKGINKCLILNDMHAKSELMAALQELEINELD